MTAKADRVKRLLEDSDFKEAFANVKRYLIEEFENANSEDTEYLQELSKRLNLLKAVKADLELAVQTGTYEDFLAAQKEKEHV